MSNPPGLPSYQVSPAPANGRRFEAVLFDLLTALLDSWTLWNSVAGSEADGRKWRAAYLQPNIPNRRLPAL